MLPDYRTTDILTFPCWATGLSDHRLSNHCPRKTIGLSIIGLKYATNGLSIIGLKYPTIGLSFIEKKGKYYRCQLCICEPPFCAFFSTVLKSAKKLQKISISGKGQLKITKGKRILQQVKHNNLMVSSEQSYMCMCML